jgi:serine/threonine protein kinase
MLLSGIAPFSGNTDVEILKKVRIGEYSFPDEQFGHISAEAKDFVSKLLQKDVSVRLTAHEAIQHPWVTGNAEVLPAVPNSVFENLKKFKSFGNLKKAALVSIAYHLDHAEVRERSVRRVGWGGGGGARDVLAMYHVFLLRET